MKEKKGFLGRISLSKICLQGTKQLPDEKYCGNCYYKFMKNNSKIFLQSYKPQREREKLQIYRWLILAKIVR